MESSYRIVFSGIRFKKHHFVKYQKNWIKRVRSSGNTSVIYSHLRRRQGRKIEFPSLVSFIPGNWRRILGKSRRIWPTWTSISIYYKGAISTHGIASLRHEIPPSDYICQCCLYNPSIFTCRSAWLRYRSNQLSVLPLMSLTFRTCLL